MWKSWWETHGGRITGVVAGLFFFFVYLFSGFWDMLFCVLLVCAGYWLGKLKDDKSGPLLPWGRLTEWMTDRWPWSR